MHGLYKHFQVLIIFIAPDKTTTVEWPVYETPVKLQKPRDTRCSLSEDDKVPHNSAHINRNISYQSQGMLLSSLQENQQSRGGGGAQNPSKSVEDEEYMN